MSEDILIIWVSKHSGASYQTPRLITMPWPTLCAMASSSEEFNCDHPADIVVPIWTPQKPQTRKGSTVVTSKYVFIVVKLLLQHCIGIGGHRGEPSLPSLHQTFKSGISAIVARHGVSVSISDTNKVAVLVF